ncbi:sigma-70 family RNA polymerase sigma factor [Streptomyces milbemycinicus]|uniref:RNA polymerase sigma factor n=1 Tax=Streptomyces milbemycinicus TaxID=476552 RepID=UPI003F4D0F9E
MRKSAGAEAGTAWAETVSAEAEIIARVRAGDTEAYAELMRAHAPIAHRTAVLLGAGPDAEDVVQDAFVKAYLALGAFRDGAAFRPWLLRIVANETSNLLRSARRMRTAVGREAALHGSGGSEPAIPESADPAVAALAGEQRARLLAALDELSEPQRRVVTYRYLLDLNESETAQALGWPRGTVKSRLSRALRRLEGLVAAEEGRRGSDGEERGAGPEKDCEDHRDADRGPDSGGIRGSRGVRGSRRGCGPERGRGRVRTPARRVAGARARAGVSPAGRVAAGRVTAGRVTDGRRDSDRAGDGADSGRFGGRLRDRSGPGRAGPGPGGRAVAGPARPDGRTGLRGRPAQT